MRVLGFLCFFFIGSVFAQGTIKIGVITDRVGVSKPYPEPAISRVTGADQTNRRGGAFAARSNCWTRTTSRARISPPRWHGNRRPGRRVHPQPFAQPAARTTADRDHG